MTWPTEKTEVICRLTEMLEDLIRRTGDPSAPSYTLARALGQLVTALLTGDRSNGPGQGLKVEADPGHLSPQQVGEIYEFLRGFELTFDKRRPVLVRNSVRRRNEGLFYTPSAIVKHIVKGAFTALGPLDLPELWTLKVLDPAMGTGLFLAEALEQLARRILEYRTLRPGQFKELVADTRERLAGLHDRPESLSRAPDDESLVRLHVLRNCLYGVDADPTAAEIAGALLTRLVGWHCRQFMDTATRIARQRVQPHGPLPNIRVGNSLIGEGWPSDLCGPGFRSDADILHARIYSRVTVQAPEDLAEWVSRQRPFHWPVEFPEVLGGPGFREAGVCSAMPATTGGTAGSPASSASATEEGVWQAGKPALQVCSTGFDVVIGNPPYEVLSARESGLDERRNEQAYFRKTFKTCQGKINTYRLMLERGLGLVRNGGALGFIVPATLLADSTAEKLRRLLLDGSRITEVTVIPEKARAFSGVTQAFLILVTVKGGRTHSLSPAFWTGSRKDADRKVCPTDEAVGGTAGSSGSEDRTTEEAMGGPTVEITRDLLVEPGLRIPLVRSEEEKALLKALMRHTPLSGDRHFPAAARVNQGEVNLTTARRFITTTPTAAPLIRGEHVYPFRVVHPSPRGGRLDWVDTLFFEQRKKAGTPWRTERLVVGRVVNMDTLRRLKAAPVPAGSLLGDMTNSLTEIALPTNYVLGLLNSSLLNWRMRLTSTNNYISAAEIQALPIPRIPLDRPESAGAPDPEEKQTTKDTKDTRDNRKTRFEPLLHDSELSPDRFLKEAKRLAESRSLDRSRVLLGLFIEAIVEHILNGPPEASHVLQHRLDLVVALLYGVEEFIPIFTAEKGRSGKSDH